MIITVKLHEEFTSEIVTKFWVNLQRLHKEIQLGNQYGMNEFHLAIGFVQGLHAAHVIDKCQMMNLQQLCCDILEDGRKDNPQITDFSITRERIRLIIEG